jgi:hypothetical protein
MGSGCIDRHYLDFGTSWRWVVSFTPQQLYPRRKSLRYPLDRRLDGLQSQSGRREEKILTGTRTSAPRSSSRQPVAILTALTRLLFSTLISDNFTTHSFEAHWSWHAKTFRLYINPTNVQRTLFGRYIKFCPWIYPSNICVLLYSEPIAVAARSKAWNVFARSNTGIMCSNPTRGMNVCVRLFCVFADLCR